MEGVIKDVESIKKSNDQYIEERDRLYNRINTLELDIRNHRDIIHKYDEDNQIMSMWYIIQMRGFNYC